MKDSFDDDGDDEGSNFCWNNIVDICHDSHHTVGARLTVGMASDVLISV